MNQNNNNIIFYLLIIIVVYYFINKYKLLEKFGGRLHYIDQHNYLSCCRSYGCNHRRCKRFLRNKLKQNKPLRIGYIKLINNKKNIFYPLFKQKDFRNVNKHKYYIKRFYGKNYHMNLLNTKTDIFDKDVLTFDKKKYKVHIYDSVLKYNNFNNSPYRKYYGKKKIIVPKTIFSNYQYIGELENLNLPNVYFLYGKMIDYHRKLFNYLILKKINKKLMVISKINYSRKLNLGDLINIRIEKSLYTPFTIIP